MDLLCAIDLRAGEAVRLVQGDFGDERAYGDPVDLARSFVTRGARWLHVVDLDAARTGEPVNREVVLEIAATVDAQVQSGGGVRDERAARALLDGGVERVVLGTAAQEQPGLVRALASSYPRRVAVGLDHRRGGAQVAVRGWEQASGFSLEESLRSLAEVELAAVVVTSIERDGTLEGPDLGGLSLALSSSAHPVIASGGVRSVDDLRAIAGLDVGGRRPMGAIVGMALAEGLLGVEEALAACDA
ncbi:MAG TPA: 1-(5-phosphoribosyl)-5-[(5-phosphoribosylamino)methylideneamino] imidazole-4-carboxamide isomerase [Acidimicrobiales bacterium]|nr:1-(5-phosphoribosyl)-5-[(5-phosphoribosylamino)methylideneamino] imidazole-4-carboxamide isomerase [Acidimicrobiales bacterium]